VDFLFEQFPAESTKAMPLLALSAIFISFLLDTACFSIYDASFYAGGWN
jgi:hypothetical protein